MFESNENYNKFITRDLVEPNMRVYVTKNTWAITENDGPELADADLDIIEEFR